MRWPAACSHCDESAKASGTERQKGGGDGDTGGEEQGEGDITLFFIIKSYIIEKEWELKKRIILLGFGITLFLLAFSWGNIVGSFTEDWELSQYGYFGMPVILGFLAYLIVKFKAFNIRLLGAQALIVAQFVMIAAMFTFATSVTNQILISITLLDTALMGWFIIRSSKKLDERKGELQIMSDKLLAS